MSTPTGLPPWLNEVLDTLDELAPLSDDYEPRRIDPALWVIYAAFVAVLTVLLWAAWSGGAS